MQELVVCSGKGGTGKTSIVASLAALADDFVLADCDVDAANLHLVTAPRALETTPFIAGHRAVIRPDACAGCGTCAEVCRFGAIDTVRNDAGATAYRVDPIACEGCGVCVHFCPADAIDFPPERCGVWRLSQSRFGPMVHADLDVGAENSGKLVSVVREQARVVARREGLGLILVDGPPGIGCPVTAALTGADLTLLVTEPSLSGLHDLQRVLDLADHFAVPAVVCINKHDLSPRLTGRVRAACEARGVPVAGLIPFAPLVNEAQNAGRSLVEHAPFSDAAVAVRQLWDFLAHNLDRTTTKKGHQPCASRSP
jgi:MinD superfamily P-loop ATPase